MIERGNMWKPKPTKTKNQVKRKPWNNGETRCILRSRSGCKTSEKIWWMIFFLNEIQDDPFCGPKSRSGCKTSENLVDDRVPQGYSHTSSSHEVSLEPTFKRREDLGKHNVHTHFPKDRNCEICKRTKITRAPCRRRKGEAVPRAVNFGDWITADHKVLSDNCESRNNHRYAVVVQDLATQWIQAFPCKNKTSQETQRSLQKFLEPERKPKVIYTDNSLEFGKACEDLSWNHCTSTPHRSETNGIAERAVRRV